MEIADLIACFKQAPPVRLKLLDLTWELYDKEQGGIKVDEALTRALEIKQAVTEAQVYAKDVEQLGRDIYACLSIRELF